MKIVTLGHGNTIPEAGKRFFLRTQAMRSYRRIGFPPVSITHGNQSFILHYAIRSAAHLTPLQPGQIWEVEAGRYRRLRGSGNGVSQYITIARLDLHQMYTLHIGWVDAYSMLWQTRRHNGDNPLDSVATRAIRVTYKQYAMACRNDARTGYQVGYFIEVVEKYTDALIVRYLPKKTIPLSSEEISDRGIPLLPHDGTPLAPASKFQKSIEFIEG